VALFFPSEEKEERKPLGFQSKIQKKREFVDFYSDTKHISARVAFSRKKEEEEE
jgi:hypothetical protein